MKQPLVDINKLSPKKRELFELLLKEKKNKSSRSEAILPRTKSEFPFLSFAQERLWFLDQLEPGSPAYNMPGAVRLKGELSVGVLAQAINEILRRHEVLRTTFALKDGRPVQLIHAPEWRELPVIDLTSLAGPPQDEHVKLLIRQEAIRPFDLNRGPVVRTSLLRLGEQDHVLVYTMHHIASDGWSMGVLNREIGLLYEAFVKGEASPLTELPIQYADYAAWQREWLSGEVLEGQLKYWREHLSGVVPLQLPTDWSRPAVQSFSGAAVPIHIRAELVAGLKQLGQQEGVTLFMILLAGLQVLLSRYSGQEDIAIGSAIANRNRTETEGLIGFFVNTLVLRGDLSGNPSVKELLGRVRELTLAAYEHQDLPFEKLVEELQPERDMSRNPLFQVIFELLNAPDEGVELKGMSLQPVGGTDVTTRVDLEVHMREQAQGLTGWVYYNTDLFMTATIERMVGHLERILAAMVADPGQQLSKVELLSATEREQLVVGWNETQQEHPQERCIHELIEGQARRNSQGPAVVHESQMLSYGELNERANQLAHYLRSLGVGAEKLVGVCMERSVEMVVGLLGVWKAGGAYVPVDPSDPVERLSNVLNEVGAVAVLTQERLLDKVSALAGRIICLDSQWEMVTAGQSRENLINQAEMESLAYVIYTSGSTGQPRGVEITHRSLLNLVLWHQAQYSIDCKDRATQLAGVGFDASVWELWPYLTAGAAVHIPAEEIRNSASKLQNWLLEQKITVSFLPTPLAELVLGLEWTEKPSLRALLTGGDRLRNYPARPLPFELVNHYGPTENTVVTTCVAVPSREPGCGAPPIGRPIANTKVYILDKRMEPVPVGVGGELYIGGAGVARGYSKRPELTGDKFIPDPFSQNPGARLYRTGDLCRYLPDGNIEFLGRIDHQVKMRGFRIELGEIESVLNRHPQVEQNIVLVREDNPGDRRLVGYVVGRKDQVPPESSELRDYLQAALPEYMVPSVLILLESLPLTPSGKVNRRALPAPASGRDTMFVSPRTLNEELMAGIWQEVLQIKAVGIRDNFFDLGGHSLLGTQLMSRVQQTFGVELPLRDLFEAPTVEGLSKRVDGARDGGQGRQTGPALVRVERNSSVLPLSFAQERLWFLDQLEPGSAAYNMPGVLPLKADLSVEVVTQAINEILRRHEVLRTTFASSPTGPVQVIHEHSWRELPVVDLSGLEAERRIEVTRRLLGDEAACPFDLQSGPVVRVGLLRLDDREHLLFYTMHHIVSDGWSMGLLHREFGLLCEAYAHGRSSPLPELPIQYADYAAWQRKWLSEEVLAGHTAYWRQKLAGAPELLELPTDRPRQAGQKLHGANLFFGIPEEVSGKLRRLCQQEGATFYMGLQAALQMMLHRYSGQEDIVISTGIGNRDQSEVEGLIGCFINTVLMRTDLSGNPSFRELLKRVREVAIDAYAHKDLPFEKLVEELQPQRHLSHNPLAQVMLVLLNAPIEAVIKLGSSEMAAMAGTGSTQLDLTVHVMETETGLHVSVIYNTELFREQTIARMMRSFVLLLSGAVEQPERRIGELPILSDEDLGRMEKWNQSRREFPNDLCLHERMEEQVRQNPRGIAVIHGEQEVSYAELNRRANRLAHYLKTRGVGVGAIVGLCVERSVEMVVGILGAMKAGAAYLPLDPAYPEERLEAMLLDAGADVLLTQSTLADVLTAYKGRRICLDREQFANQSTENPNAGTSPEDLAYVIYTSGSTGRPKGIEIRHRGVTNNIMDLNRRFNVGSGDRVLGLSSLSFDMSVYELLGMLECGATVVIPEGPAGREPLKWAELIVKHKVTIWNSAPALLKMLVDGVGKRVELWPRTLRLVLLGGDWVPLEMPGQLKEMAPGVVVIVMGGATEASIHSSIYEVEKCDPGWRSIPYGRPMANQTLYVLNRHMEPVPVGVGGELYLGGIGLARGYHGRPELTAEKFVPNPFANEPGERLYRTGDLVKYGEDGLLELLGRIDFQVKIRGYRIELGEVEAALRQCKGVKEAVVMAREDEPKRKQLVGYLVPTEEAQLVWADLRQELKRFLPEYMVPATAVILDRLPLSPNGKIDRRALPAPEWDQRTETYAGPRNAVEEFLTEIWQEVLNLDKVGIHDNFFEVGGHSLLATQVISRLAEVFPMRVPLRTLFERPTVAELSQWIESVGKELGLDMVKVAQVILEVTQVSENDLEAALEKLNQSETN